VFTYKSRPHQDALMSCSLTVLAPKSPFTSPPKFVKLSYRTKPLKKANMSVCVACSKPLEVEIERDEDEEYENGASSSGKGPAPAPETVPDDVQMSCGCHFHWLGIM
jgi:hypothetical protein